MKKGKFMNVVPVLVLAVSVLVLGMVGTAEAYNSKCGGFYERPLFTSCINSRASTPFWVKYRHNKGDIKPDRIALNIRIHHDLGANIMAFSQPDEIYFKDTEYVRYAMMPVMPPNTTREVAKTLFAYTNIATVAPNVESKTLPAFEKFEAKLASEHGYIDVFTGTFFQRDREPDSIYNKRLWIPTNLYKLYILPDGTEHAFFFPNSINSYFSSVEACRIPPEALRKMTGFQFND